MIVVSQGRRFSTRNRSRMLVEGINDDLVSSWRLRNVPHHLFIRISTADVTILLGLDGQGHESGVQLVRHLVGIHF